MNCYDYDYNNIIPNFVVVQGTVRNIFEPKNRIIKKKCLNQRACYVALARKILEGEGPRAGGGGGNQNADIG